MGLPAGSHTGTVQDLLVRPDGQILAAVDGGRNGWTIQAYTDRGHPDVGFGGGDGSATVGGIPDGSVYRLAPRSDGGFAAVGQTRTVENDIDFHTSLTVVGLRGDGSVDHRYADAGILTLPAVDKIDQHPVDVQTLRRGGLLIAYETSIATEFHTMVLRLRPDGRRDAGFGTHGKVDLSSINDVRVSEAHVARSGRISYAGYRYDTATGWTQLLAVRITPDGELDTSFGTQGFVATDVAPAQPGHVLFAPIPGGWKVCVTTLPPDNHTPADVYAFEMRTDGSIDPSFGGGIGAPVGTIPTHLFPNDIARYRGGVILAGTTTDGTADAENIDLFALRPDGGLDTDLGGGSPILSFDRGFREFPLVIVRDAEHRLLFGGQGTGSGTRFGPLLARVRG